MYTRIFIHTIVLVRVCILDKSLFTFQSVYDDIQ